MMEDDRLDRALHLVALVTVRCDDVENFAWNPMLVSERDAAERMAHLLAESSLDHFARAVLVVLEWFADVRQQRACDEVIALNGDAAAEGLLKDIGDRNALPRA